MGLARAGAITPLTGRPALAPLGRQMWLKGGSPIFGRRKPVRGRRSRLAPGAIVPYLFA